MPDHKSHTTEDGTNYYDVNKFGYVPVLEMDNGKVLREGPAIMQYLADRKPELGLVPANGTLNVTTCGSG